MSFIYHYILMSQKDFLENQVIEEIMRERANFYQIQKKQKDFWILMSPLFLKNENIEKKIQLTKFYEQNKKNDSYVVIISLNKDFIKWIELRFGFFENLELLDNNQIYTIKKDFQSNGISGILTSLESPLLFSGKQVYSEFLNKKFAKSLTYIFNKKNNILKN